MSKKYSEQELFILKHQGFMEFTEEDLKALKYGEATIKQSYNADKCLEKHKAYASKPISRQEAFQSYVPRQMFDHEITMLKNHLAFLSRTLVDKKIISPEELEHTSHVMVAETWDNLCDTCKSIYPECGADHQKGKDIYPDLENSLADKVVKCDKFQEPDKQGTA